MQAHLLPAVPVLICSAVRRSGDAYMAHQMDRSTKTMQYLQWCTRPDAAVRTALTRYSICRFAIVIRSGPG